MACYIDTSALAKWYLNEPGGDEVEAWIRPEPEVWISSLTLLEMTSLLNRKRRGSELSTKQVDLIRATLDEDVARGFLLVESFDDQLVEGAEALLRRLHTHPLRTLDVLHLSACLQLGASTLATADRVMARAGAELGLELVRFD